jgi:hypothetical protein
MPPETDRSCRTGSIQKRHIYPALIGGLHVHHHIFTVRQELGDQPIEHRRILQLAQADDIGPLVIGDTTDGPGESGELLLITLVRPLHRPARSELVITGI